MRFHSRVVKADFWHDPDLCDNLPFLGRIMYQSLWALADDSCCIIDSPTTYKREIFGDEDAATVEKITEWRDTLVRIGKLVPYEMNGRRWFWIKNMHKHQRIDKPNPPSVASVPLPPWVQWKAGQTRSTCSYVVIEDLVPGHVGDMSATSSGQVADMSRSCRCIEPRTLNLEPEKVVSLSERAHAREEAAAASEPPAQPARSAKRWKWSPPELQPYLTAWRRAGIRRGPSGPLADTVLQALAGGVAGDLVTWIVGEMGRRTHLPMSDPDHVGDEAAYASGIVERLLAADPPVTTLAQYQARDAEFRARIESKRARAAPGEEVELEYGKFR